MSFLVTREMEAVDILFIEHESAIADCYRQRLEREGYRVRVVESAAAVTEARRRPPDLLCVELSSAMPQRFAVVEWVRREIGRPDLPAVVLSIYSHRDLQAHGVHLSARDHAIRMPLDPQAAWPAEVRRAA